MALGLLAAGVLVVDQASKTLVVARLEPGEYIPLLGDFFGLQLVFNPGAAFSFATGSTWIFTLVAVVVTVVIVRISRKLNSRGWAFALGALLGGNLGNLGDRLFRDPGFPQGHVVDFLNYNGWFVGNVADIAIVGAAVAMAILAFLGVGVDGTRHLAADAGSGGEHGKVAAEESQPTDTETDEREPTPAVEKDAD